MSVRIVLLWVVLFGACSIGVAAQETIQSKAQNEMSTSTLAPTIKDAKFVENWLSMSAQFNDRLLATVYWALGVIGVVFAGLLGYNWFLNSRIYERDKDALISELRSQIQIELSSINKELAEQAKNASALVEKKISDVTGPIEAKLKHLTEDFHENSARLWLELYDHESKYWESKGVIPNAMRSELKRGELALEIDNKYALESALKKLEGFLPKVSKFHIDMEETRVVSLVDRAPAEMAIVRDRIKQIISKAQ